MSKISSGEVPEAERSDRDRDRRLRVVGWVARAGCLKLEWTRVEYGKAAGVSNPVLCQIGLKTARKTMTMNNTVGISLMTR